MGQQQLLLIILGVIIVGIAVAVGITMFQDNAVSANKDAVTNDLVNLAAKAQQHYRKPVALGGGGNTFQKDTDANGTVDAQINIDDLVSTAFSNNDNGVYKIDGTGASGTSDAQNLYIVGHGKTADSNDKYCAFECKVTSNKYSISPLDAVDAYAF